ncbi:MAG: hypothetical protein RL065_686 [Bacteroidota bacterium]|jgi:hypothetical protein
MNELLIISCCLIGVVSLYRGWLLDNFRKKCDGEKTQSLFSFWIDSSIYNRILPLNLKIIKNELNTSEISTINGLAYFLYFCYVIFFLSLLFVLVNKP